MRIQQHVSLEDVPSRLVGPLGCLSRLLDCLAVGGVDVAQCHGERDAIGIADVGKGPGG